MIEANWGDSFDNWFDFNGQDRFENLYVNGFLGEFSKWMNVHDVRLLKKAGKSLVYALKTYRELFASSTCEKFVLYAKTYIENQMEDFDLWSDAICIKFEYDERVREELAARACK
jgi:hypothetical protein